MRNRMQKEYEHLSDDELMALTIWAESRGEPLAGKVAVGTVILNRVSHRSWDGRTIREVCLKPRQFSCFNDNDPQRDKIIEIVNDFQAALDKDIALKDCHIIAQGLIKGVIRKDEDLVKAKCCQYLTTAAKEHCNWWKKMRFVKRIGEHWFYTDLT